MKMLTFVTLSAFLILSSCSHYKKSCCAKQDKQSCDKAECKDDAKKSCCSDDHCKKKS